MVAVGLGDGLIVFARGLYSSKVGTVMFTKAGNVSLANIYEDVKKYDGAYWFEVSKGNSDLRRCLGRTAELATHMSLSISSALRRAWVEEETKHHIYQHRRN